MSLLPPPCDELTIVEPFSSATLVNPPLVIKVSFPDNINGLKSICLGCMLVLIRVGLVESLISGCATKFLGFEIIFDL